MSQYYFIVSKLNGLVLDVEWSQKEPGTKVSPWEKNGSAAQLWIDDPASGTIRTKLNNYCLDIQDGVLVINPYNGHESQKWRREGEFIVSGTDGNKVLDISAKEKSPRAEVISYAKHGELNQKWIFEVKTKR